MPDNMAMADLMSLIENEIPEGKQNLKDSHINLEKVAEYCETNYFQAENKRAALEETKNYTTQSLASVAYQINTLAYNLLHMLDLQTTQLTEMESHINHIAQTVMVHKEKVARREIGILTTNKSTARQHKILAPANPERPIKYIRKPIDYTVLDEVGHGLRAITPRARRTPSTSGSGSLPPNGNPGHHTLGPMGAIGAGPAPTTKPPTPPQAVRSVGSLSRGSREYRTPAPPIAPPTVPSNYAPNYPLGHPRAHEGRRGSGYSTLPPVHHGGHHHGGHHPAQPPQQHYHQQGTITLQIPPQGAIRDPQVGMVHPLPHHLVSAQTPPPPSPPEHHLARDSLPDPPPPPHLVHPDYDRAGNVSPPLPPPPPPDESEGYGAPEDNFPPPSPPVFSRGRTDSDCQPKTYMEKVVAIYDYHADKDDELSFSENSVIFVVKKNDDGWYEGVLNGVTGLFPGNYVEPCL